MPAKLLAKNLGSPFPALFDVSTVEACWYLREVIWKNNIDGRYTTAAAEFRPAISW